MSAVVTEIDKEELRQVVAEVIEAEVSEVVDDARFVDDLAVDSLMALEVVVVLEKKYGVSLRESELRQINCLQAAYEILLDKVREGRP